MTLFSVFFLYVHAHEKNLKSASQRVRQVIVQPDTQPEAAFSCTTLRKTFLNQAQTKFLFTYGILPAVLAPFRIGRVKFGLSNFEIGSLVTSLIDKSRGNVALFPVFFCCCFDWFGGLQTVVLP